MVSAALLFAVKRAESDVVGWSVSARGRWPLLATLAAGLLVAGFGVRWMSVRSHAPHEVAEVTPDAMAEAETFVYRSDLPEPLRLHVFKPAAWRALDRRPALMIFFGGDWTHGTPLHVADWTRWAAASLGLVGVAPDYRTAARFGASPFDAVHDARAALRWVEEHASELGLDPQRVIVGGDSTGGHLALWTALTRAVPDTEKNDASPFRPAALVLTSAVSDTSVATGYTPERFGTRAEAFSPVHQLDARMPPVLMFHGDADRIVPYIQSVRLRAALLSTGNACELITISGGTHNFGNEMPEWRDKIRAAIEQFLRARKLLP